MDRFDEGNKLKTAHHVALYASSGEKKNSQQIYCSFHD